MISQDKFEHFPSIIETEDFIKSNTMSVKNLLCIFFFKQETAITQEPS